MVLSICGHCPGRCSHWCGVARGCMKAPASGPEARAQLMAFPPLPRPPAGAFRSCPSTDHRCVLSEPVAPSLSPSAAFDRRLLLCPSPRLCFRSVLIASPTRLCFPKADLACVGPASQLWLLLFSRVDCRVSGVGREPGVVSYFVMFVLA